MDSTPGHCGYRVRPKNRNKIIEITVEQLQMSDGT